MAKEMATLKQDLTSRRQIVFFSDTNKAISYAS